MQLFSLDQMLPADHRARSVWSFVKGLDLRPFYAEIQVTHQTAGQTAIAPEVLIGLWLLATLDGIGAARELARRCETDLPYLWMRGTVSVNYHTLSDFRVAHGARLERLLVDTVAALVQGGIVPLETIAQDGMRVRASAGGSSFRRQPTLKILRQAAEEHVARLQQEADSEAARLAGDARRQAAVERAARERQARVEEALRQHQQLSQQREQRHPGDGETTRVSTTDPDEYVTFRARMAAPEYQTLYKSRPSIAEFPNADCRNRNLRQFRVRGLAKVKAVALWHALAFNFLRRLALQAQKT